MDSSEMYDELGRLYEEKQFEALAEKLNEVENPVILCAYISLLDIENGDFEKAHDRVENFKIEDYLQELEYFPLFAFRFAAIKAKSLNNLKKVSEYLYELTKDPRQLYGYLDLYISSCQKYSDCSEQMDFIIETHETLDDILRFSSAVVYGILLRYNETDDERIYDLAFSLNETYLVSTNLFFNVTNFAKRHKNHEFIYKFVDKLIPYMQFDEYAWLEFFDVYDAYVEAKLHLGMKIEIKDLEKLRYNYRYLCKYHKAFLTYIDEIKPELSELDVEIVKILNKKRVKLSSDHAKLYKNLVDRKFEKVVDIYRENRWYFGGLAFYAKNIQMFDAELYNEFVDYIIDITNNADEDDRSVYAVCFAEYMFSRKQYADGQAVLDRIDYDERIDLIFNFVTRNAKDTRDRYLLGLFGDTILKNAKHDYTKRKAKELLAAWYFYENREEEFYETFAEIEEDMEISFSEILHKTEYNIGLTKYLIKKQIPKLAYFYHNAFNEFVWTSPEQSQDIEMAKFIAEMVDKFFDDYPDYCHFSRTCVKGHMGIVKYYFGEIEEAERLMKEAAYESPNYCNCGISNLATLNDYIKPDESYELNKEMIYNSLHGLKLVGENEYVEDSFNNFGRVVNRYAYYALCDEEGFDKEFILNKLRREDNDIDVCYYRIKLLKALNRIGEIAEEQDLMRREVEDGLNDYDRRFLEILDDINCPLYKDQNFEEGLKIRFEL